MKKRKLNSTLILSISHPVKEEEVKDRRELIATIPKAEIEILMYTLCLAK
jgi:hypothetical protein